MKRSIAQTVYYSIMPVVAAGSLFFGIGKAMSNKPSHNPSSHEERIRALEVSEARSDERWEHIKSELVGIKTRLDKLSGK